MRSPDAGTGAPEPHDAEPSGPWEEHVSGTWQAYQEHVATGSPGRQFLARHPWSIIRALYGVCRLPLLTAQVERGVEGRLVHEAITGGKLPLGPLMHKSVLLVPEDPTQYSLGAAKQTLRRQARKAAKLGVVFRRVDDVLERKLILDAATEWEREQPDARYRNVNADNGHLLDVGLWLVAYVDPDEPILLSVTSVDGPWASLSHYRTIGNGEPQTKARYLLMQVLVEELSRRGIRYLVDERAPAGLPNGVRHFQRMLGFRIFRVRARFGAAEPSTDHAPARHLSGQR